MIWATSITDASFDNETKAAAWAAWIRVDNVRETIKEHGVLKHMCKDINEAELYAALNGVWLAVLRGRAEAVLVQTDSLAVCNAVCGRHRIYTPMWRERLADVKLHGIKLEARHVPGHSGSKNARSWVNEWCDTHAKKAMREQRKVLL